jgi:hypothetical protein
MQSVLSWIRVSWEMEGYSCAWQARIDVFSCCSRGLIRVPPGGIGHDGRETAALGDEAAQLEDKPVGQLGLTDGRGIDRLLVDKP